jgi:hypothetical protein
VTPLGHLFTYLTAADYPAEANARREKARRFSTDHRHPGPRYRLHDPHLERLIDTRFDLVQDYGRSGTLPAATDAGGKPVEGAMEGRSPGGSREAEIRTAAGFRRRRMNLSRPAATRTASTSLFPRLHRSRSAKESHQHDLWLDLSKPDRPTEARCIAARMAPGAQERMKLVRAEAR